MGDGNRRYTFAKSAGRMAVILAAVAFLPGMQGPMANFEDRVLASHNEERRAMGLPALKWDAALARRAQTWANHLAAKEKFEHSPNIPGQPLEGENIWGGTSASYSPEDMVDLWIAEKSNFVRGVFPANSATGRIQDVSHYTQIVWRNTGAVGCALSRGRSEDIMVCRYSDPGNMIGTNPLLS